MKRGYLKLMVRWLPFLVFSMVFHHFFAFVVSMLFFTRCILWFQFAPFLKYREKELEQELGEGVYSCL